MPDWITITLMLLAVLAVGAVRERWRHARLRDWAARHAATLHWPVEPDEHPELPAAELAARFETHGARRWAAAMQGEVKGRRAWILEYLATPPGVQTSRWYSLLVVDAGDATGAEAMRLAWDRSGARRTAAHGRWTAERREGLIRPGLLDGWFAPGA